MWRIAFISLALVSVSVRSAFTIEEPKYSVVHQYADFEVRDYPAYLVAETAVDFIGHALGRGGERAPEAPRLAIAHRLAEVAAIGL